MMSTGSDPFFQEEGEAVSYEGGTKKPAPQVKRTQRKGDGKPPSFGLVVAIAFVALLLGIGIGYFAAMAVVDRSGGAADGSPAVQSSGAEGEALPSGHPDIASMINPDGTVDQEALEAYKASRASQGAEAGE